MENCTIHRCTACKFGKEHPRKIKYRYVAIIPVKETELKKYDLHPGQRFSNNHYEYKVPGRLYYYRRIKYSKDM